MGRIRSIKPEFFKHEKLFDAEVETGFPLRIAFAGLWTCCDREGRFEWRPRALKTDILPYDELDFSRVLDALVTRGFVVKYASNGKEYGCIPSFHKHQVINNREKASEFPIPPQVTEKTQETTREARVDDALSTRQGNALVEGEGEREDIGVGGERADSTFRERLLVAMGHDKSGLTPSGGIVCNSTQMIEVERWLSDLSLSEEEVLSVVSSTPCQTGPPRSPKYYSEAMQRFAGEKSRPPLKAIEGSSNDKRTKPSKQSDRVNAFVSGARGTP